MLADESSVSEQSSLVDASLIDNQSTIEEDLSAASSAMDASFTSFEEIINPATDRMSNHSRAEATADTICSSKIHEYSEMVNQYSASAWNYGEAYAKETQLKAMGCAAMSKATISDYIKGMFSPEQDKKRAEMVHNVVSVIRTGLSSCHDSVDTMLVKVFDQPVEEVEVRQPLDQGGSASFNEDITIDSILKRSDLEDSVSVMTRDAAADLPKPAVVKKDISRRVRLESIKKQGHAKGAKERTTLPENFDQGEENKGIAEGTLVNVEIVEATDSDVESLLRFEEELYNLNDNPSEEAEGPADELDELDEILNCGPMNQESRNGEELLSSTSVEELDRALRTDIEKLDRMAGDDIQPIQRAGSDMLKISQSSSTPLRGNRGSQHHEPHFMHLARVAENPMKHEEPTRSTIYLPSYKKAGIKKQKPVVPTRSQPVDDVIDLTMYAEENF